MGWPSSLSINKSPPPVSCGRSGSRLYGDLDTATAVLTADPSLADDLALAAAA
jgi:hypothetical protein